MDYEAAMTSPTELLAPDVFPEDITDLNGNATRIGDQTKENVDFHQQSYRRLNVRCLVFALVVFIIATVVMAGLFAWRMETAKASKDTAKASKTEWLCFSRAVPEPFHKLPKDIEQYLESLKEDIKHTLKKDKKSVALVNLVYYDKVIWEAKYTFDITENEIKTDSRNSRYPVASVTKVITSLLALKLHNDGNISLDDSITKFEPTFSVQDPFNRDNGKQITVRQLISYLSGLPREAPCYPDDDDSYCPHNQSYIMQRIRKSKLLFAPGSDVLYGNLAFALAGHAISKNYLGGYSQLVHDKIFAPFGMQASSFNITDIIRSEIYPPHDFNGSLPKLKEWGWLDPAGGLLTTVDDLARLEIALFNNSATRYLKSAILDEFYSPIYFFPDEERMLGTPWNISFEKGYLLNVKDGYVYGYGGGMFLNPHLRLAMNTFTTSSILFDRLRPSIARLTDLFHVELMKLSVNTRRIPVPNPDRFIGDYRTDDVPTLTGSHIKISTSKTLNDSYHLLTITLGSFTFDLSYIGDNVLEIMDKQCQNFNLGINGEKLYFKDTNNYKDKMMEFIIYGIHLRGSATFYRKT